MADFINMITNNGLEGIARGASNAVINAIGGAAIKSGVDFAYLVQQAKAESSFNPDIEASTSSASGLFQFINSTWMSMVDKYGDEFGIDTSAQSDEEILELRKDPEIASHMAAQLAADNQSYLENNWDAASNGEAEIGATELYFAHFLGAGNAAKFLNAKDENGAKLGADLFPAAAQSNTTIFYDENGDAKTLDEIYVYFDQKFETKDIDAEQIMTDTAIALAEQSVETTETSPLQLSDGKPDTRPNYSQLVTQTNNYSYASPLPNYQMMQFPVDLMLLSQLELPGVASQSGNSSRKNSLF